MEAHAVTPANAKIVNPDGTVNIKCKYCGNFIMKMMYRGFSTSVCLKCQGIDVPEEEQSNDALLYPDKPAEEKLGTAKALFRALGFGRKKEPKPKSTESAKIVREKKRKPLFGPEDKE